MIVEDLEGEVWKPVKGYEDLYMISNKGRLKSLNYRRTGKERLLKPHLNKSDGYLFVVLAKNSINKKFFIHRLVAEAFLPNPNDWPVVNHKNEIKIDNRENNLEWCTQKYNVNYGTALQRAIETNILRHRKKREKPIEQFTLDGKFLTEYKSIHECARLNGFKINNFPYVLKGRLKSLYGYIWKYKNDEDK